MAIPTLDEQIRAVFDSLYTNLEYKPDGSQGPISAQTRATLEDWWRKVVGTEVPRPVGAIIETLSSGKEYQPDGTKKEISQARRDQLERDYALFTGVTWSNDIPDRIAAISETISKRAEAQATGAVVPVTESRIADLTRHYEALTGRKFEAGVPGTGIAETVAPTAPSFKPIPETWRDLPPKHDWHDYFATDTEYKAFLASTEKTKEIFPEVSMLFETEVGETLGFQQVRRFTQLGEERTGFGDFAKKLEDARKRREGRFERGGRSPAVSTTQDEFRRLVMPLLNF